MAKQKDFSVEEKPTWCSGCGDWSIWGALKQALVELKLEPHEVAIVYDIGCSGNMVNFVRIFGFHGLHGRAIPTAVGIKLANSKLNVFVIMGDGGCYGEGLNHFLQVIRGNHDITLIVSDNQIYGLTTGQKTPTSLRGHKTKSTPEGSQEIPLDPMALALAAGAGFVGRGFSADIPHLKGLIKQATLHRGLGFIDVLQPCVTFNKLNTYDYFRERIYKLEEMDHDKSNFEAAMKKAMEWPPDVYPSSSDKKIPLGVFYKKENPMWEDYIPLLKEMPLVARGIEVRDLTSLFRDFI